MSKGYYSFIIVSILLLTFVVAQEETYKQGIPINLPFTCSINGAIPSITATVNISISSPTGSIVVNNQQANALGNGAFNYTYTFNDVGVYKVQAFCYDGADSVSTEGYYVITSTGNNGGSNTAFIIFLIVAVYTLALIGFFKENEIIAILAGMFMLALGIYLYNSGFIIIKDWITQYFAYLTIGFGIYLSYLGLEKMLDV